MAQSVRLIVAMEDDVLVVDHRDGDDSRTRTELSGLAPQCLAGDPHQPARLYCGTFGHGLWRSDDAGDSWQRVGGFSAECVTAVAVSDRKEEGKFGTVFVGTEPSALFRSNDGASTWQECPDLDRLPSASTWSFPPRPSTHHVRWISLDPAVGGRLLVAIEAGALIHSQDGGTTWRDRVRGGPYDTHTLVRAGSDSNHLYVAAGDGYFESDDGGATWQRPEAGLEHRYLWSVAIDSRDAEVVIVSAARDPWSAHGARSAESYLYQRANGRNWTVIRDGLPPAKGTTINTVIADRARAGIFYAANNQGIYRSDGGLTWEKLTISWPERFRAQRAQALVTTIGA
jgi:photosystem II stability/assembly factor-like uncharacterized protein